MAETVQQEPTTPAAQPQEERTFTQSEMNAIIQDRLNRERSKYADYDTLKAKTGQHSGQGDVGGEKGGYICGGIPISKDTKYRRVFRV